MLTGTPATTGRRSSAQQDVIRLRAFLNHDGPFRYLFGFSSAMLVLGCIAQRLGGELDFDRQAKRFTNNERANTLLKDTRRKGWEQYYSR